MVNQISYNNNIINLTINNTLFFPNQNKINSMNNQIPYSGILPISKKKIESFDDFPGNNNRKINIYFDIVTGLKINIAAPINIKVKDLLLVFAKKVGISPNDLGKLIFLYNGYKININEEKDLISFGFEFGITYRIVVVNSDNLMGGNSKFYLKLKSKI